ncbi:hypothetical protein [Flavobacterium sp. XGLA_31]|uniref:hypothetical protein n=1 Tax=Flavobacterium sp. XGLA_31 TaxID=3447666 RepID=UPI003F37B0CF
MKQKIKCDIVLNSTVHYNGAILHYQNKKLFFDYSDDSILINNPADYDFYFKRSLLPKDKTDRVLPLNFNVPLAYKSFQLLTKLSYNLIMDKSSRIEVIRALDAFDWFTNNSHNAMDVRKYPAEVKDNGGKIIFYTRLWNPDRHGDAEEKERRRLQNDFRINACRIIKKNFENASVGLFPDELSLSLAPDIVLDFKDTKKKSYFQKLQNYDIGIADDGLKDTPGWKIGEYLFYGKALITTPLNVCVDDFYEGTNYLKLSSRSAYEELPDKIETLLKDKKYLEMADANLKWSKAYIHPFHYIERLLNVVNNSN